MVIWCHSLGDIHLWKSPLLWSPSHESSKAATGRPKTRKTRKCSMSGWNVSSQVWLGNIMIYYHNIAPCSSNNCTYCSIAIYRTLTAHCVLKMQDVLSDTDRRELYKSKHNLPLTVYTQCTSLHIKIEPCSAAHGTIYHDIAILERGNISAC